MIYSMQRLTVAARLVRICCIGVSILFAAVCLAPAQTMTGDAKTDAPNAQPTGSTFNFVWRPKSSDTWHWQLQGEINTTYDVKIYAIDLFSVEETAIRALQKRRIRVLCYFSAGSSEDWTPDFRQFQESDMGNPLDGWEGERWLDVRSQNVRNIIGARIQLAAKKGCDGIMPDNVDGFEAENNSGFDFGASDQLVFNRFLAKEGHRWGLAVALKNDMSQVSELADEFELAVNEECHEYDECDVYRAFLDRGKLVMNAEYGKRLRTSAREKAKLCEKARKEGIQTLVLPTALDDSFRFACH